MRDAIIFVKVVLFIIKEGRFGSPVQNVNIQIIINHQSMHVAACTNLSATLPNLLEGIAVEIKREREHYA